MRRNFEDDESVEFSGDYSWNDQDFEEIQYAHEFAGPDDISFEQNLQELSSHPKKKRKNRSRTWNENEDFLLCELFNQEVDLSDIAKQLARPKSSLMPRLIELSFTLRDIPISQFDQIPTQASWDQIQTERLHKGYALGYSIPEIAKVLDRSTLNIARKLITERLVIPEALDSNSEELKSNESSNNLATLTWNKWKNLRSRHNSDQN